MMWGPRMAGTVAITLGAAALAGCRAEPPPAAEPSSASGHAAAATPEVHAAVYRCGESVEVVAVFGTMPGAVVLALPERTALLPAEETASGARYSDGAVTLWVKGDEARVDPGDGTWLSCERDEVLSALESGRARGAEFWAAGSGLEWLLEGYGDRLVLRISDDHIEAVHDGETVEAGAAVIRGREPKMSVAMAERDCRLGPDGAVFPETVVIQFDGRSLNGCGIRFP